MRSYGGRGFVEMSRWLADAFGDLTGPQLGLVDQTAYLRTILLPELAVRLIMQDLGCAEDEAVRTLEDSRRFGLAVWPYDDN